MIIVLFAVAVGKFWAWWKSLGEESALLFQMAVGVIILALGFAVMSEAALEFERNGSSAMYYLVLAYSYSWRVVHITNCNGSYNKISPS